MDTNEFVRRVKEETGLTDRAEVRRAIVAAFEALAAALPPDEAHDLGSQLPRGLKELVWSRQSSRMPAKPLDWQTLLTSVRNALHPGHRQQAAQVTRAIFAVLREAVSPGELDDIVSVLPPELQRTVQPA